MHAFNVYVYDSSGENGVEFLWGSQFSDTSLKTWENMFFRLVSENCESHMFQPAMKPLLHRIPVLCTCMCVGGHVSVLCIHTCTYVSVRESGYLCVKINMSGVH